MKDFLAKFRDERTARGLLRNIRQLAPSDRVYRLMEVCGTHTVSIYRFGMRELLPANVELLSGPGCPVCVTDLAYIDKAIALARREDVLLVTFGDLMKVPGSSSSLIKERGRGRRIKVVYSPIEALPLARANPDKKVVILAVGFETTIPAVLATVRQGQADGLDNLFLLTGHKIIPPAMKFLLQAGAARIDGFICPGHVSTIIGSRAYEFLAKDYHVPCVVAGFEPTDILQAVLMLLVQLRDGRSEVENQYQRAVRPEGNPKALAMMDRYCRTVDDHWRGIGIIPESGLRLRDEFGRWDINSVLDIQAEPTRAKAGPPRLGEAGCICGQVLQGLARPSDCKLFAKVCTPEEPVGACMVSSEGSCAAAYKHRRLED